LGLPQDAWIVGNVGRLHPDKDQATLLRGFAQALPNLPANSQLVIVGKGRLEQDLREQAMELGIGREVLLLGQVPQASRYFKAFDAFALSSDHEPFGMVLLEAMIAGVPLIATSCGGAKEVVEGVGILFPLKDAEHLAQGLVHLSGLDTRQRESCAEMMLDRLRDRFSDEAVRSVFWRLPQVTDLTAES
jgi:glycosyltransferase involved in cell wall biosynthesis